MKQPKVLVSACLLGVNCRYDGNAKLEPDLAGRLEGYQVIPFCPEGLGNLPVPRLPAEIQNGDGAGVLAGTAVVVNRQGQDYTAQFRLGAEELLRLYQEHRPEFLICKANSPSCGVGRIYDGTFSGKLRPGDGVAVALLRQNGALLFTETEFLQNKPKNNC